MSVNNLALSEDWESRLAVGKSGELAFKKLFEERFNLTLEHLCNKGGKEKGPDFRIKETGQLIELKSDQYKASDNFFLERYSDKDLKTPGGVMQALGKGCNLFAYLCQREERSAKEKLFIFPIEAFAMRFLMNIDHYEPYYKRSKNGWGVWYNESYIMPKNLFTDLNIKRFKQ